VGDEGFRRKSKEALLKLIKSGVTTVLVSHNLEDMEKICDRVLCLDRGELIADGDPRKVIETYQKEFIHSGE
jgi:ABC-type polysaccharide/polyol phosphate transport system ATPase subunit